MRRFFLKTVAAVVAAALSFSLFTLINENMTSASVAANATIINCNSNANIREYPTNQSRIVGVLNLNSRIQVTGSTYPNAGDTSGFSTWYSIQFDYDGQVRSGYIAAYYVNRDVSPTSITDAAFEGQIASFPESYKQYLRDLHQIHPAWQFVPVYTGYNWDAALNVESRPGASLISNSSNGSWKSKEDFAFDWNTATYKVIDASNWVNASREIIAFYMDPRNSLNETAIFQFMDLCYLADNSIPGSAIQGVLNGTFMQGQAANQNGDVINYCDIFADAGNICDVNPIFLASHVLQECSKGGSTSSNGATGFYNLYNIGAYSSVISASVLGLNFARDGISDPAFNSTYLIPWNTPGKSIVGGGMWIRDNYAGAGQSTLYFMRFNFDPAYQGNKGYHQYMTATASVYTEASKMQTAYVLSGFIDTPIVFKIPVFDGMPDSAVRLPANEVYAPSPRTSDGQQWIGRDPIENFCIYLYSSTLFRNPDAPGLQYWYDKITVEGKTGEEVAFGFVFSNEMNSKNLSDEDFIKILYHAFLGREYDPTGLEYWKNKLSSGGYSRVDVYHGFSRSNEFIGICNNAGFTPYPGYSS